MIDNNKKKLTINDIAKLCGVGKSTVSRVLNKDPMVNEETRQKVNQIIEKYQFTPSKSARAMRGYSNRSFGIIMTRLDSYAENQAVSSMLPIFYKNNIDPIILESQFKPEKVDEHLKMLAHQKVDGIILFAFSGIDINTLADWKPKMVVIARPLEGFVSICHDDESAVRHLMNYFHKQKHYQNISYIGINIQDETTGLLRYQSYLQYCKQHELIPHAQLGELNYQSGYLLAKEVLTAPSQAILCATDSLAFGVQKFLSEQKISDIDVACIGRNDLLTFLFPQTKFYRLGFRESGKEAANILIKMAKKGFSPQKIIIPGDSLN
ncbi:trehalose operon repressor TreR [Providencia burhodogranariea]|uniref:Trehalose repressor n=1 Tax=Providencia burhodogranariea DSM 19968 TaxID=1141662 RepID=K8X054_9GAMM|nr:trehalose operon repressor TreR [Providencia burhodogranariea]EKT65541.1 trehalose repressor [Providencia burhodogranariea DSM 19968]